MQRPSPVDPARQDLGKYSDVVTAHQPLGPSGPMAQDHPMTSGIQDEDLRRSPCAKCRLTTVPLRTIPQGCYEVDQ